MLAIVQARMGSSRLPGKAMAELAGKPMLAHVLERVKAAPGVGRVLLAVPDGAANRVLEELALEYDVPTFYGPEDDVLERYELAARAVNHEGPVVRITADDAFKDPAQVGQVIEEFHAVPCDFASNCHPPTYPVGCDVEVIGRAALAEAARLATDPGDREHVTPYLVHRPRHFRHRLVWRSPSLAAWRWTVDTPADLEFARAVYDRLYWDAPLFGFEAVRALLDHDPTMRAMMPRGGSA